MLEVGLAVLLVAPVAGVATALATFVRDRERDYALITALLLAMLTVSFALTLGG